MAMAGNKPPRKQKYFTVAQANAALPLVRAIVRDVSALAADLRERHERLLRILPSDRIKMAEAHREEFDQIKSELERDHKRMQEYRQELESLGVELKDFNTGLVDFPCWMDDREVFLCWRLGEPEVAYWHELDAGFAGRQKLMVDASSE
jgi:hypothetical protein